MNKTIIERYQNDPVFAQMVDVMRCWIEQLKTTPTEVREAAMLAQILYEERKPARPISFSAKDVREGRV